MSENTPIKNWAEDLNRHVPKEDTQMANRHKKRCSTWLVVGEMQTKTTMRFHLTPFRMTLIKKSTNSKLLECGEKGTCDWWECTLVQPLWRTVRRCLKKLKKKNKTENRARDPTPKPLSGENYNSKRYMHPCVHSSSIYNSQDVVLEHLSSLGKTCCTLSSYSASSVGWTSHSLCKRCAPVKGGGAAQQCNPLLVSRTLTVDF